MRWSAVWMAVCACLAMLPGGRCAAATPAERAEALLAQMTLDEKVTLIGGGGLTIRPIERLGIPEIVMSDGPMGCRCYGNAAAFPGGIALAATWNRALAQRLGVALGRECRARGVHILLAPGVNIYRSPLCGRNFEYLGEDPFLASQMVGPLIQGVQSQEVLATVKHFAANNQEWDRHKVSSDVDERTLHEIYLPAFRAAVQQGNTRCVMTAYNLLNGVHCSQHRWLITDLLKQTWGFDGIVMSDWGSTYDGVAAALAGLDLEMPVGDFMNRKNLEPAVADGRLPVSVIDDKVRRILRTCIAAGFFDRPQKRDIPLDDPQSDRDALEIARESLVLLKNRDQALPLGRRRVRSVAVLGPNAHPAVYGGGGSAFTDVFRSVSIYEGLKTAAGPSVRVERFDADLPFVGPLTREMWSNRHLEGAPARTDRVDGPPHRWRLPPAEGIPSNNFSARWRGEVRVERPGDYVVYTNADDGSRLYVNDRLVIDDWTEHAEVLREQTIRLEPGVHRITVEYFQAAGDAVISFGVRPVFSAAAWKARIAGYDAVVYCAGFNPGLEGEGHDRPFDLPEKQRAELSQLAAAHRRVIVVINSGGGIGWEGWHDRVAAVLQAWYPGQQVGTAVAEVLFGDVCPSGRLPATFERRFADNPSSPYYHIRENDRTPYTEGIFVGYRGFDRNSVRPQYPFGHGLSYTRFAYSDLRLYESRIPGERVFSVECRVRNLGQVPGREVVQLYVGAERPRVDRPVRELKGFDKVLLQPGESKVVSFTIREVDLARYDATLHRWVTDSGPYRVEVGSSSRDLRLRGRLMW